ncbi:Hypothetical_protein [Hexamita inflata]|uniref:Hypothetical_protein n=1 Tax=Hexamita inflata TaxID=28002 RepID=A0AA86U773_9EUKA|nr:Hypothetical protein HINF_LOCUS20118 [Hexamita inflata]
MHNIIESTNKYAQFIQFECKTQSKLHACRPSTKLWSKLNGNSLYLKLVIRSELYCFIYECTVQLGNYKIESFHYNRSTSADISALQQISTCSRLQYLRFEESYSIQPPNYQVTFRNYFSGLFILLYTLVIEQINETSQYNGSIQICTYQSFIFGMGIYFNIQ